MKKLLSAVLAASMLLATPLQIASAAVIAMDEKEAPVISDAVTSNEPTPEQLEAMIKKVRPLIEVPEEYEEFDWYFNSGSYYSMPSWELSWSDNKTGSISIRCDSEGRIINYENYKYGESRKAELPEVSPEELLPIAEEFIAKTAPYTKGSDLRLENVSTASLYNHNYTYKFTRCENGIIVPDNTITVSVNHDTKDVKYFYCSYTHGVDFKNPEKIITEEEAKKILSENQKMVLSYRLKTEYDEETWELKSRKAYLVYTPEKNYVSVDAFTGEVYNERNTWSVNDKGTAGGGSVGNLNSPMFDSASKEESAESEYQLTEKELEQLGVLEKLISKDEAVEIIVKNTDLYIDPDATAITARLTKDTSVMPLRNAGADEKQEDRYIWNIDFHAPSNEDKYHYSYMYAVVDAQDGSIIRFNCEVPGYYYYSQNKLPYPEIKFSDEEASKIANSFIKKHQSEKHENIRLADSWEHTAIKYVELEGGKSDAVYGCKTFRFVRVNEGVDFTQNSFSVSVDLVTGKITSYSFSWYDDVEFESPKDAITPEEALYALYSHDGFGINYEINSDYTYNKYLLDASEGKYIDYDKLYSSETYSRAVYSAYALGTNTIRALDGKMIDYSGEEYKEYRPYSYSDIEGHWAEDTILRFSYAGIGFDESEFRPDDGITSSEMAELFTGARLYNYAEDFILPEGIVTRADAVKYIIHSLGYGKVAALPNVFITDFADGTVLKSEDVGFIAIARAFGIIEGDGNTFRPYDKLTRAEALTIVENVINGGLIG